VDESRTAGFSKVLEGKNALVIGGGGGGIGRAITRGLATAAAPLASLMLISNEQTKQRQKRLQPAPRLSVSGET